MNKLIYLPLESYIERYTYFMSSIDGWTENHFRKNNVEFIRIEGRGGDGKITTGSVLDAYGRSLWSISQIEKTIELIQNGKINDGDVIYTEDFWHSGIDALFYIRELTGIKFKIGCFIHAQSVDDSDFTYPFREWMRPIEIGYSRGYDYVFTCSPILQQWCELAGYNKPYLTGLPFNSTRLLEQLKDIGFVSKGIKKKQVVFSSRFDDEKNPMFFLNLVRNLPHIDFKLCKPRKKLSNNEYVEQVANSLPNLEIVDTSNKLTYYSLLDESLLQFNCAKQDWVSWTLLEATLFGCQVLYPYHKDFPSELNYNSNFLYSPTDLCEATTKVEELLNEPQPIPDVYRKHDLSWNMKLKIMGLYGR